MNSTQQKEEGTSIKKRAAGPNPNEEKSADTRDFLILWVWFAVLRLFLVLFLPEVFRVRDPGTRCK